MDEKELIVKCREDIDAILLDLDNNSSRDIIREYAKNASGKIRRATGERFGKKGQKSIESAFLFLEALKNDEVSDVKWTVAVALGELGSKNYRLVLDVLRELADDPDWSVRESVASALITIHKKNADALTDLMAWAKDSKENVRRAIAESLGRGIGLTKPECTFEILKVLLGDDSLYVRKAVANSCRNMSRKHGELVLDRLTLWKDDDSENARWTVADGCRTIANEMPEKALPLLYELAKDDRKYVQGCVVSVLKEANKSNRDIIMSELDHWLSDKNENVVKVASLLK